MITKYSGASKRTDEIQEFIDANPDKFRVITPEETAATVAKQLGGYWSRPKKKEESE